MRRIATFVTATLALLGLAGAVAGPAAAAGQPHFHSAARGSVVIEDRTGNGAWSAALSFARAEWNRAGVLTITDRAGSGSCDTSVAGVIIVCQKPYAELKPYQGVAYTYGSGDHLSGGRIFVCSDCADDARKQVIAAHEVGHTLGLGHIDDGRSLMCPSGCAPAPTDEDLARLRANHAHTDSTSPPQAPPSTGRGCLLILCL